MQVTITIRNVDLSHRGLVLILSFKDEVESWLETVSITIIDLKTKSLAKLWDQVLAQSKDLAQAHVDARADVGASWAKPQQFIGRVFQIEV